MIIIECEAEFVLFVTSHEDFRIPEVTQNLDLDSDHLI